MTRRGVVHLPTVVRRSIVQHARQATPRECCGFLIGTSAGIQFAMPMANAERSAVKYRIDERAHIDLRRALRAFVPRLEIRGVYHSHPVGAAAPSPTDIAGAHYPEWVHVIVGLKGRANVRAFRITKGQVRELRISLYHPFAKRPS